MEMTDDTLRSIANHIVNLMTKIEALETIIVVQLGVNPQLFDQIMKEAHASPSYQPLCDQIFEQLKDSR
jgi:hypothetical protein